MQHKVIEGNGILIMNCYGTVNHTTYILIQGVTTVKHKVIEGKVTRAVTCCFVTSRYTHKVTAYSRIQEVTFVLYQVIKGKVPLTTVVVSH